MLSRYFWAYIGLWWLVKFDFVFSVCDDTSDCTKCYIDGKWEGKEWGQWGTCNEKCKVGKQTRERYFEAFFQCCSCPTQAKPEIDERDCGVANNGCEQTCSTNDGICSCYPGYELKEDGKNCEDIDECSIQNKCHHKCENSIGSYKCRCEDGYYLDQDEKSCKPRSCPSLNFPPCPVNITDKFGSKCLEVISLCSDGDILNSACKLFCGTGYGLSTIPNSNDFNSLQLANFINVQATLRCEFKGTMKWDVSSLVYQNYYCRRKNDPPRNLSLSSLSILEHSAVNTVIGNLSAEDDLDDTVFSIEFSPGIDLFSLKKNQLIVKKTPYLQDLSVTTKDVVIRASDNGNPPMYIEKLFPINIINVNDPPQIIQLSNTDINNTKPNNTVVGKLSAIDYDAISPKVSSDDFVWSLHKNDKNHFRINGSDLVLHKSFDNEDEKLHEIIIKCTDKDKNNPKYALKSFYLNIINSNSRPATVSMSFSSVDETTSTDQIVGSVTAVDLEDNELNIELLPSSSDSFIIDNKQCKNATKMEYSCIADIVLVKALNYEQQKLHVLSLKATDPHDEYLIRTFNIKVNDINEPPTAIKCTFTDVLYADAAINVLVGHIQVMDEDNNAHHNCHVLSPSLFAIRNGTYNIVVKSALKHNVNEYNIHINCTDSSNPLFFISGACKVSITEPCNGPKCDRDPSLCENFRCRTDDVCSIYKFSTDRCVPEKNQMKMLLPMPPAIKTSNFLYDFEDYVMSIILGNSEGRSLDNLKGDVSRRKKRTVQNIQVEAIVIYQLQYSYLYVSMIPRTSDASNTFLLAKDICPKFVGTDISCVSKDDCGQLKKFNVTCPAIYPIDPGTNAGASKADEKAGSTGWVIGLAIGLFALIVLVVIFVILRRRRHQKLDDVKVQYNNQAPYVTNDTPNNTYECIPTVQRLPFENEDSCVTDVKNRGDIKVVNNDIFISNNAPFSISNPAYGLSNKNNEQNKKTLNVGSSNSPEYASIGKSASNKYDRIEMSFEKAKEIEIERELKKKDSYDHIPKRGTSINQYDPHVDDKEKITQKKKFYDQ